MSAALTPYFEELISRLTGTGRYNNRSEVIRAGLRALEEQEFGFTEYAKREYGVSAADAAPSRQRIHEDSQVQDARPFSKAAFLARVRRADDKGDGKAGRRLAGRRSGNAR